MEQEKWDITRLNRELYEDHEALCSALEERDAVINLAGASIIARWTVSHKSLMYSSRINTTNKLVKAMADCEVKPGVFISTSAVGIYAHGGPHTEARHSIDKGFLGNLATDWEEAALKAEGLGIRTVIFRFGIVLGPGGGALKQMLPAFKMGIGGTIGDGSQPFSWIHITDLQRAYKRAIEDPSMAGVYNLVSPTEDTNKTLTKTLSEALKRPAFLRIPELALRIRFGEGAHTMTHGQMVVPERLINEGFSFKFNNLKDAIEDSIL